MVRTQVALVSKSTVIAYAAFGRADIIVSLNLKHLANARAEHRLNAVNFREGYPLVSIRTPEQVVQYED